MLIYVIVYILQYSLKTYCRTTYNLPMQLFKMCGTIIENFLFFSNDKDRKSDTSMNER